MNRGCAEAFNELSPREKIVLPLPGIPDWESNAELPVEPGCDVFVYGRNSCRETGYGIGSVGQKNGLVIKCFHVIFEDAYFYIMAFL